MAVRGPPCLLRAKNRGRAGTGTRQGDAMSSCASRQIHSEANWM